MNKVVKELAEQAWDSTRDEIGSFVDYGDEVNWDFLHTYVKKFAELIVLECIDVVSPYVIRMENFDGGHPITDLKKHFGIEK